MVDEYYHLYAVERELWLLRGLRRTALDALAPRLPGDGRGQVLEVACGTGAMLDALRACSRPAGIDLSAVATGYGHERRGHSVARASMTVLPFADGAFDAVLCLDALGAVPPSDDAVALGEMARVLRPGGALVLWAAAHPALYGAHDRATGMAQRHCRQGLWAIVQRAGLTVDKLSYANMCCFPGIAAIRLLRRLWPAANAAGSDVALPPRPVNVLLSRVMELEAALLRRRNLPFGLSLFVVARREG